MIYYKEIFDADANVLSVGQSEIQSEKQFITINIIVGKEKKSYSIPKYDAVQFLLNHPLIKEIQYQED